jgi:hypothetical protein
MPRVVSRYHTIQFVLKTVPPDGTCQEDKVAWIGDIRRIFSGDVPKGLLSALERDFPWMVADLRGEYSKATPKLSAEEIEDEKRRKEKKWILRRDAGNRLKAEMMKAEMMKAEIRLAQRKLEEVTRIRKEQEDQVAKAKFDRVLSEYKKVRNSLSSIWSVESCMSSNHLANSTYDLMSVAPDEEDDCSYL